MAADNTMAVKEELSVKGKLKEDISEVDNEFCGESNNHEPQELSQEWYYKFYGYGNDYQDGQFNDIDEENLESSVKESSVGEVYRDPLEDIKVTDLVTESITRSIYLC